MTWRRVGFVEKFIVVWCVVASMCISFSSFVLLRRVSVVVRRTDRASRLTGKECRFSGGGGVVQATAVFKGCKYD